MASYVTVTEYIRRYGEYETRAFTNTEQAAPSDTYDSSKVEAAISDASDEIDGYVSTRYTTPLDTPPAIVVGWAAAIARLKLAEATGRVNDAIRDAAASSRRQLEQLAAGKLNLPISEAGGEAPEQVGSGDALTSGDAIRPIFGNGGLCGFMDPFVGRAPAPNWIRDRD